MTTTITEIEPGERIDLTRQVLGIDRTSGRAVVVDQVPGRPPQRIDGISVGAPYLTGDAPHDGEMHPDGDEILYVLSGAVSLRLELPEGDRHIALTAGDATVVPRGVWHQVTMEQPGQLLHITPGPGGDARARRPRDGSRA